MPAMKVFSNRPPMKKIIVVDDHDIVRLFIKRCREDAQLTLTAFALKLGITKAALSSYENKGSIIPLKKLVKFLAILGYRLEIRKIED
jgi:transcriptional regulator with XRE-family HTH domain